MVKYTVAMATFDDFYGVFSTIQALRMYQDLADCEIIVLDNNPDGPHGKDTKNFVENINSPILPTRYIEQRGDTGTSLTRHRLFELAQGELVIVMDCHIMLKAGAMATMKKFWESADADMKKNLFTGPLLMDSLNFHQTHFECEWRGEMWGTWATAWKKDGKYWIASASQDGAKIRLREMMTDKFEYEFAHGWAGHETQLKRLGFELAGWDDDTPFEVPAQGLGLFLGAKEHWLGFNPHHKHFGGEECYIHEKYRKAGRKTLCLPWMGWNHRFGRPEGPRYPITTVGKMRNYVLEFMELGLDLEPIRKHFVEDIRVKQEEWDKLIADPINYDPYSNWAPNTSIANSKPVFKSNFGMDLPIVATSLNGMATEIGAIPRDSEKHFGQYMKYGTRCDSIVEFNKRRETTLFWAAALDRPKGCSGSCRKAECDCKATLVSYQEEQDTLLSMISDMVEKKKGRLVEYVNVTKPKNFPLPEFERNFDLLYVNEMNSFSRVSSMLDKYADKINKYIVLRGVASNTAGETGEDGQKPGLKFAIKMFLKNHPEWFITYHTEDQYGFTVLSKLPEDKPGQPILITYLTDDNGQTCGVGTELKRLLKDYVGIEASPNCGCNARAAEMDARGPDWCEENIDDIVKFLKEQADNLKAKDVPADQKAKGWSILGHLFSETAAKLLVKRAIKVARKKIAKGECS